MHLSHRSYESNLETYLRLSKVRPHVHNGSTAHVSSTQMNSCNMSLKVVRLHPAVITVFFDLSLQPVIATNTYKLLVGSVWNCRSCTIGLIVKYIKGKKGIDLYSV